MFLFQIVHILILSVLIQYAKIGKKSQLEEVETLKTPFS